MSMPHKPKGGRKKMAKGQDWFQNLMGIEQPANCSPIQKWGKARGIIISSQKFLLLPSGLCAIGVDQISQAQN
jgi:hypothetical protein